MAQTTTSGMLPTSQQYYTKKALDFLKQRVIFQQHCQLSQVLPSNAGRTVNFYRYTKLNAASTPLTEGATPAGSNVSRKAYTVTPSQYGDFTIITDMVADTDIDSQVVSNIQDIVSEQMARTVDIVCRTEFVNFSQVVNAGRLADASFATTSVMTAADLKKAARDLGANDVPFFEGNKYHAIVHPNVAYDLISDTATGSVIDIYKYQESKMLQDGVDQKNGYRTTIAGVEVYESTLVDTTTVNGVTAYRNFVVGKNAFACVQLDKNSMSVIRKNFGEGGDTDPLDQRMTLGWKAYVAGLSLDDNAAGSKNLRSICIRAAATA